MKKHLIILVSIISVGLIATSAFACYWDGVPGGRGMGGRMHGAMIGQNMNVPDSQDLQKFLTETAELRQTLAGKQGEFAAVMAGTNPDPNRAALLSREIMTLQDQVRAKAAEYNLPGHGFGRMGHMGNRGHMGRGMNTGQGACW